MGQQNSSLSVIIHLYPSQKMCCNNNLCNYDNNVENLTEVNKKSNIREEMLIKNRESFDQRSKRKGGKDVDSHLESIDVLSNSDKRQELANSLQGNKEYKAKLAKVA